MMAALAVSLALVAASVAIVAALHVYATRRERRDMRRHVGGAPWEWWGR